MPAASETVVPVIHGFHSAALREMKRLHPRDIGEKRVGHFGFFRRLLADKLWLTGASGWRASPAARPPDRGNP